MEPLAYCPYCGKTVTAFTILGDNELKLALAGNSEVEVMHTTDDHVDHKWKLDGQAKNNLREQLNVALSV